MAAGITFTAVYDGSTQPSDAVTADHFGLNLSFGWNKVGDEFGWQNFDDIAEEMNAGTVRWPGGADGERYLTPELDGQGGVSWDLGEVEFTDDNGNTRKTQSLEGFLNWCDAQNTTATIIIPTSVFATHWNGADARFPQDLDFNAFASKTNLHSKIEDTTTTEYANFKNAVKAYVKQVLEAAQAAGNVEIAAFEIGNEYSSFMNAKQYGQVASHMTLFIEEAIQEFKDDPANDPNYNPDPDTLVQTRSNLGTQNGRSAWTFETLEQRADNIIAQFTPDTLANVDGIISHYYYRQGEWSGTDNDADKTILPTSIQADYDTIDDWFVQLKRLISKWEDARTDAGILDPEVDWHFTEWNVNSKSMEDKNDPAWAGQANYGMKQIAPLLEMFSAMVANGVDAAQIWSARNHATSVGLQNHNGDTYLQIAGHLMKTLQDQTVGKSYVELGVHSATHDAHFFKDDTDGVLFVSSRDTAQQVIEVDLRSLGVNVATVQVTIGKPDTGKQNTKFTAAGLGEVTNVPSYLEPDVGLLWTTATVPVLNGIVQIDLGSYEVAYINVPMPTLGEGDDSDNSLSGTNDMDFLRGFAGDDVLHGGGNNDVLEGGSGNDYLSGGSGNDHFDGGGHEVRNGHDSGDYADLRDIVGGGVWFDLAQGVSWGNYSGSDSYENIENVWGSLYNDTILGDDANNVLIGGGGYDTVRGAGGNDILYGGWGHDTLEGGTGNDFLHGGHYDDTYTGGAGADTFVFTEHDDRITDFNAAEGDRLQIDDAIWGGGAKTDAQLLAYASVVGGDLVFDFGWGNTLTLEGVTDASALVGQMTVI